MKKISLALVAAVMSSTVLVACGSEDTESAAETTSSTSTQAEANESAEAESEEAPASEEATQEEAAQVETADGNTVIVPGELAAAIAEYEQDWGTPLLVRSEGENFLVEFADQQWLTFNPEVGAQPLVGMIGQVWLEEGGLTSPHGLPIAEEVEGENGWSQAFQSATISWIQGENGEFEAEITPGS